MVQWFPSIPNVQSLSHVISLAYMAYNAYNLNSSSPFFDVANFSYLESFGYGSDAIKAHLFHHTDFPVLVLAIKGTSPGDTLDKLNDNFMFSCCCKFTDCNCLDTKKCSQDCVTDHVREWNSSYYRSGVDLIRTLTQKYRDETLWLTGHSLGGALAGVLALAFDLHAVAFEAPGDALFAHRLGFIAKPGTPEFSDQVKRSKVFHIGNTGDPVFTGNCWSHASSCYLAGFSIETKCHLGQTCVYSSPGFQNIYKHRMAYLIDLLNGAETAAKCTWNESELCTEPCE